MNSKKPTLVVAVDIPDYEKAYQLASTLSEYPIILKMHWVLYPILGSDGVEEITSMYNGRIFFDFKMHDIPSVISQGVKSLMSIYPFEILTLHASGGFQMLRETREARDQCFDSGSACKTKPNLLGVTIVTSLKDENLSEIGSKYTNTLDASMALAQLAHKAGLDGVVASVHELKAIKDKFGDDFKVLTPGIRPEGSDTQDQARVATPKRAKELGSDYIVVGRPITKSEDPRKVVEQILHDIS
jgi:orotidine-5'-phosphate decarboxylase